MGKQGPVPQHRGQLALDIPFLISLKIKLSFTERCTWLHTTSDGSAKNQSSQQKRGFKPTDNFSELPSLLSSVSPRKRDGVSHFKSFSAVSPKLSTPPTLLPSKSIRNHWVPTAAHRAQQRAASLPAVPPPVTHPCREGRDQQWSPPGKVSLAVSES